MASGGPGKFSIKLQEIRDIGAERLPREEFQRFSDALTALYGKTPQGEVVPATAEELYGASLALWKFCQTRKPGEAKLRLYNPRMAEHGWESSHTILEICNDDMPFLVDSVIMQFTERGIGIHGLIHPVLNLRRDETGALLALSDADDPESTRESIIQVQVDQIGEARALLAVQDDIAQMLVDVRAAVEDWKSILQTLASATETLRKSPPRGMEAATAETTEFLDWLGANHFTFLGHREFHNAADGGFRPVDGPGLGLMRDPDYTIMRDHAGQFVHWSSEMSEFVDDPSPVLIIKANRRSNVHRAVHFDVIALKTFDAGGRMIGAHVFIGLFTSAAYNRTPREIPLLREKIARVIARAGFSPASHDGKALTNVLETYPRDELFQSTEEQLYETAIGVLQLATRPRTRLFMRRDRFGRFMSCIVYIPRDRYSTELRVKLGAILSEALNGRVAAWSPQYGVEALARVHFVVAMQSDGFGDFDPDEVEQRIVAAVRSWGDQLLDVLIEHCGEHQGHRLHARFADGIPANYRETVPAAAALADIQKMDPLGDDQNLALHFYRRLEDPDNAARFKIYRHGASVPLSDCLPVLENMGFRILEELPFQIQRGGVDSDEIWIHDFYMLSAAGGEVGLANLRDKLEDLFDAAWRGVVDDDPLNRLVLLAGLRARETALLRAYSRFLRQARIPFSIDYMEDALAANPEIVQSLVMLFNAQFDPANGLDAEGRAAAAQRISESIETALEAVPSLDVDQILRRFRNAILTTLRTNYFQPDADGNPKDYMSFKFDSGALDDLPLPRPWREIFVYSTWIEGVHLRGGPVARGGLRWSDRKEDYRTEVLGLVKAQQVKNAVIVPVGSKGGFLPKRLPAGGSREEVQTEAIRCYRTFLSGLLDLTDNLDGMKVIPPQSVIRRDSDDPYLVVAADKGTATFSDIANGIAAEYGFWLDDAFASGGSNGYDHKGMAITARGAWEAVKRHFRELGHDTQTEPFRVVGIGDMSGDVFGNGMLLSDQIGLVAAFDHRDIFIDPAPDLAASFAERKRVFDLPRSSWRDYDESLISEGGGIFSRSAKSIALTPQIKAMTGLDSDRATPFELMRALLKAPADLLWFGGIGTYVKAREESQADAGDRANDAIRVDADEIGARVIGEGANLGVTQRARIALSRRGVKINTDAVDNSAGVDCSDHEVNIKIALGAVVAAGDMTEKQRNKLLAAMTDEVAALVLRTNYTQTLAISLTEARAPALLDDHARFMRRLEDDGQLNREVETLPADDVLAELGAAGLGLTRPEISVLIAYAKIGIFDDLIASSLPDDPYMERHLIGYMPEPLRAAHEAALKGHRLRREIISTVLANAVINETGPAQVNRVGEETGARSDQVVKAFVAGREIFELGAIRDEINALDNKVDAAAQTAMHLAVSDMLVGQVSAILPRAAGRPTGDLIGHFKPGVAEIAGGLSGMISEFLRDRLAERVAEFERGGAPRELAERVGALEFLGGALDIVDAAHAQDRDVTAVADTYFAAGARLGLDWLRAAARQLEPADHWERVACSRLVGDLRVQQSQIAAAALAMTETASGGEAIAAWAEANAEEVARADALVTDLRAGGSLGIARLAVATSQFRAFAG